MYKIIKRKVGKSNKYFHNDQQFASKEEIYILWFLDDLVKSGHIKFYIYQPEQWKIIAAPEYYWVKKNKKSETEKTGNIMDSLNYTPDFEIVWNWSGVCDYVYILNEENISVRSRARKPFVAIRDKDYPLDSLVSYIDVNGDAVKFPVLQKIIFFCKGIYVEKIVPEKLFKKTFYPARYLWTDGLTKKRKI